MERKIAELLCLALLVIGLSATRDANFNTTNALVVDVEDHRRMRAFGFLDTPLREARKSALAASAMTLPGSTVAAIANGNFAVIDNGRHR